MEHKRRYLEKCFSDFFMYKQSQWGPMSFSWAKTIFNIPSFVFRRRKKVIETLVSAAPYFIFDMNENEAVSTVDSMDCSVI